MFKLYKGFFKMSLSVVCVCDTKQSKKIYVYLKRIKTMFIYKY